MDRRLGAASLHRIWVAFTIGVLGLAAVLTVVADVDPRLPVALPLALAAAIGGAGFVAVVAIDRIFAASPPQTDDAAVGELRTRLVLQAVIAETVVLLATIVAFTLGPRWTVTLGGLAGALILLRIRPHGRRLARFDAAWQREGHDVSVRRALAGAGEPVGDDGAPGDADSGPTASGDRP